MASYCHLSERRNVTYNACKEGPYDRTLKAIQITVTFTLFIRTVGRLKILIAINLAIKNFNLS